MHLKEWLASEGIAPADFARQIGRTPETIRRYIAGERIPDRETMPVIFDRTGGAVTANDFFDLTAATATCSTCEARVGSPEARGCTRKDCGLAAPERLVA